MLHGIDVSKWQGAMNWATAIAAGAKYAFIRAGSCDGVTGQCYTDDQFEANYAAAHGKLPLGCYWYLRLDRNAEQQAKYFIGLLRGKVFELPLVIDVEMAGEAATVSNFAGWLVEQYGELPMIYTRATIWDYLVGDKSFAKGFPLWVAHYGVSSPSLPATWQAWDIWQYGPKEDGAAYGAQSKSIDHNWAREEFINPCEPGYHNHPDLLKQITALEARTTALEARVKALESAGPPAPKTIFTPAGQAIARCAAELNKAGKPVWSIYPRDNAPTKERIFFKTPIEVDPAPVTGDGGAKCYKLVTSPVSTELYVRIQDGTITKG
jgi:GH25 family lysozyme M1 (1,4-beta-N-acetylmuramidase)